MGTTMDWIQEAATQTIDTSVVKSYKLYKGEVELYFDPEPHEYWVLDKDGNRVPVPNVTDVLHVALDRSMALVPWGVKLAISTIEERLFTSDGSLNSLSTEEWRALLAEAKGKHKEKLNDASNVGKIAHDALEATIREAINLTGGYVRSARHAPGLPEIYKPGSDVAMELRLSMARNCYMSGLDWIRRHNVQFLATEKKIYSRAYFYTGTLDGIGWVTICDNPKCCRGYKAGERVLACIDWKSSNQINKEYSLQTAGYVFAEIEESGLPISHRFINRLGKTEGDFETWLCGPDLFEVDLTTFLDCLRLYNSNNLLEERRKAEKAAVNALIKAEKAKVKEAKEAEERAAKEERKLAKQAERDAKKAIREEEKAERRAAKAKPGPVLVDNPFTAQPGKLVPVTIDPAFVAKDESAEPAPSKGFDEDFWVGGFGIDAGGKQVGIAAVKSNIVNLNEDTVNNIEPKPAVVPEIQAMAEDRATKPVIAPQSEESRQYEQNRATIWFWSIGNTYTGRVM